jgi:hypothetical protein
VLLQHPNDLLFREPRSLHLSVLVSRPDSKSPWRKISVAGQSHTIEHVADLIHTFALLESAVCDGGFVFLETPNVADRQVFAALVMTPHTFLLSDTSLEQLSKSSNLRLVDRI